jgi:hypothetical protein
MTDILCYQQLQAICADCAAEGRPFIVDVCNDYDHVCESPMGHSVCGVICWTSVCMNFVCRLLLNIPSHHE